MGHGHGQVIVRYALLRQFLVKSVEFFQAGPHWLSTGKSSSALLSLGAREQLAAPHANQFDEGRAANATLYHRTICGE